MTDHLEQRVGAELVDRQIAELVDDKQRGLEQTRHLALDAAGRLGGGQRIDDIDGTGKQRRAALEASGMRQGDRQMRLADTDTAEQDHVAVLGQEVQAKHLLHLRPADLLRPTPIEAVERLDPRQVRRLHPTLDQGRITTSDLALDQLLKHSAMRPRLASGLRHQGRVVLGEIRQLQTLQIRVQQHLSHCHRRLPSCWHKPTDPPAVVPDPAHPDGASAPAGSPRAISARGPRSDARCTRC